MPMRRHGPDLEKLVLEIPKRVKAGVPATLAKIGTIVEAEAKRLLLTPGRGRLRQGNAARPDRVGAGSFRRVKGVLKQVRRGVARTNIDLTNRASAPGDPPAPDTMQLYRSVASEVTGNTVSIGPRGVPYAAALEYGATNAGKGGGTVILPRPYMRPAVDATRDQVKEEIVKLIKRGSRR